MAQPLVEIVQFPKTRIAVLSHRGAPILLGKSLKNFIEWRKAYGPSPKVSKTFNIIYTDPANVEPDDYRLDLAVSVTQSVEDNEFGVYSSVIPEGPCAKIRYIGTDDNLSAPVQFLYQRWLQDNEVNLRSYPLFFHRVTLTGEVPPHKMITDIYLPISYRSEERGL
ncbi:AraC family transcriptional regulator [Shewanella waksmanii]|uniref:AraC family transcriptional regulator n=1 Tax=Shewanella waksmanii TaxID=213783 RepID=UPI0004B1537D|nr:GyrI-like domain-containing protein [Shewanella waksmanii]